MAFLRLCLNVMLAAGIAYSCAGAKINDIRHEESSFGKSHSEKSTAIIDWN